MEIRKIQPEEINNVVKMWKELVDEQLQYDPFFRRSVQGPLNLKSRLHEYVKDQKRLLVGVFIENKIIGYLLAEISEYPPFFEQTKFCNLRHLYIQHEYRHQGYGKRLIEYVKEWARKKGLMRIELLVAAKNQQAIEFYNNQDFNAFVQQMAIDL